MLEHKKLRELNEYFTPLSRRRERGVYFYRINGYSETVGDFLRQMYDYARKNGVVIDGGIPNPDSRNIEYYNEMMGGEFSPDKNFVDRSLAKWLPRMAAAQRSEVANSIVQTLSQMQSEGKTAGMLKNAYIKFMCWLYYKFERILGVLGADELPKILYFGKVSNYELLLLSILSNAGCDVVMVQTEGDSAYLKLDPRSQLSELYPMQGLTEFPQGYCVKAIINEIREHDERQRLYGTPPAVMPCTNAWIDGDIFSDVRKDLTTRGNDKNFFYNVFARMCGVLDRNTYQNDLYQLQLELKNKGRKVLILDEKIPDPTPEEMNSVPRHNYSRPEEVITSLTSQIRAPQILRELMVKSFVDIMLERTKDSDLNLSKLAADGAYLLCWLRRYQPVLFRDWKLPDTAALFYLGGCKDYREAMFLRFAAKLPVDVVIFMPNLNQRCCLEDPLLYEKTYETSVTLDKFPRESTDIRLGTTAYHAERELDELMYQDSGLYRNQQYSKADSLTLKTMFEEIEILWREETKVRPNFNVVNDVVNVPVIFAKVSGVKDGNAAKYWQMVNRLVTEDTFLVSRMPIISPTVQNPIRNDTPAFFFQGKLQRDRIKSHRLYPYGFLRMEVQDRILDKLELLIEQRIMTGTYQNGAEFEAAAAVLMMPLDLVRMIQKYDFTKVPPKLVYVKTTESVIPFDDAVIAAFLNLIGFDVVFFVPTGYQNIETHYSKPILDEHQIGEYMYDLRVPHMKPIPDKKKKSGGGWSLFRKK